MKTAILPIVLSLCLVGAAASNAVAETTSAAPAVPPAAPLVAPSSTLTPEEWQELRTARMVALKANPDFVTKSAQLSAKIRAFQEKLDAAMLKTDPKLAPVLAKFEGVHRVTQTPSAFPQSH
jgi:hypothetical protein